MRRWRLETQEREPAANEGRRQPADEVAETAREEKMQNLPNVYWIETSDTKGWYVNIQRAGKKHQKFFAIRLHGGKGQARTAASRWRDSVLAKIKPKKAKKK
jgi:hypothetical protein